MTYTLLINYCFTKITSGCKLRIMLEQLLLEQVCYESVTKFTSVTIIALSSTQIPQYSNVPSSVSWKISLSAILNTLCILELLIPIC